MTKKQQIIEALRKFINQRSGIDYADYGERESFLGDYRLMLKHGRQARTLLRAVELRDSITADDIIEATSAFSGRLQIITPRKGGVAIDYTTGQYFPTEYREAACAVLTAALWNYWRTGNEFASKTDKIVCADIQRMARGEFGRAIASTWFN